ncbi:MAG: C45 family peptidase [Myxococcota bacterium]
MKALPPSLSLALRIARVPLLAILAVEFLGCGAPGFEAKEVEHGRLTSKQGVWILEVDGNAAERGHAIGTLLRKQIRWLLPRYLKANVGAETPPAFPLAIVRSLAAEIPKPHIEQLNAIAAAAGVDREALLIANLAPEVWSGMACSCLAATGKRSHSGTPLLGRNLDWYGGDALAPLTFVLVEHGATHSFASVTYPGLVGVVSGMNDAGLSAANLVVLEQRAKPVKGMPVMFALRSILENHSTVEQASAALRAFDRTVPQNYAFADLEQAAVFETWRTRFVRRDPKADFVAIANAFDPDHRARSDGRYESMLRAGKKPVMTVKDIQGALNDVALDETNLQALVFEPRERVLHISTRPPPAARGPFVRLELAPLLNRE